MSQPTSIQHLRPTSILKTAVSSQEGKKTYTIRLRKIGNRIKMDI